MKRKITVCLSRNPEPPTANMRYTFPHHTPKPGFVQPDYARWEAVQIGMERDAVIELLGPPRDDEFRGGKARLDDPHYLYGYLQMPMLPHPRTYAFSIGFDERGKVFSKVDPFNGRFSEDGSPTIPEIFSPPDRVTFSHYPRILDLRWNPSSGAYPMTYTVELGWAEPPNPDCFHDEVIESDLQFPFFTTTFGGAQPGRFRVRARNEVGESGWSVPRCFTFTV